MSSPNPYEAPRTPVADVAPDLPDAFRLNRIASGQRMMVLSILVSIVAMGLGTVLGRSTTIVGLGASILNIVGVVRLSGALGKSGLVRTASALAMLVPLVNLLVMLRFSAIATRTLRAAGYKVGLFGANQRAAGA